MVRTRQQRTHQQAEATPDQHLIAIVIEETWTLLWSEENTVAALPEATPNAENSPLTERLQEKQDLGRNPYSTQCQAP